MTSLRLEIEHECQELLVGELDPPTPIHVVLLECAGHGLKYDATLYKVVERNAATPTAIKLGNEEPVQLVGQAIPKVGQRSLQFVPVNRARVVPIVALKSGLPVGYILPERTEFLEVDCPASVPVENAHHDSHRLRVERCPCAIRKRLLEFDG